jgi:ribosomal protein S18 acetylase RimI-like enzyme
VECDLRPATESDREFLYELYRRTMREVIERTWSWDEEWQRREFERRFETCMASVIECDGRAVGGLLLDSKPEALDIVELQVLPDHQGRGIGTSILQHLIRDGARRGVDVTLSVVPANPRARQLYERLGFQVTAIESPFIRMRFRQPGPPA